MPQLFEIKFKMNHPKHFKMLSAKWKFKKILYDLFSTTNYGLICEFLKKKVAWEVQVEMYGKNQEIALIAFDI